jgi:hypothetical protein
MVSEVMEIVVEVALGPAISEIVVPTGNATEALAGMVMVCAVAVM